MEELPSSSSSEMYDVFLSFRGEDTRDNFTSHLHAALLQKNIETYFDNKCLERGHEISPALLKAIEDSKVSVVVLSKNYADSSWCLDELVHMLRCRKEKRNVVIPIFYGIDPSYIRRQLGSILEERFKDRIHKVPEWKNALTTIANLSGRTSRETKPESKLVKVVVEDIMKNLDHLSSSSDEFKDLIGIDKRIEMIENMLSVWSERSAFTVGIWGMGGIGKTTLARVLFKRLHRQFEGFSFILNVRDETTKVGLENLERRLFSELLAEDLNGSKLIALSDFFKGRLSKKKVLVILDDVSDSEQFEMLVGRRSCFGPGSRIIVTTRDFEVLRGVRMDKRIYKVDELDDEEALQLFCLNAFKETCPPGPGYANMSKTAINYAGGIPLALKVLGSSLFSKSEAKWETTLEKFKEFPNKKVQNALEISYHSMDDDNQQSIFLDIACFLKGEDRDFVERILKYADTAIDDLIDKSLVTMTPDNKLSMHDLIQEMGREIVRKESVEEPGKRSRLWRAQDIHHVLKSNTGTSAVQGIFLDMSQMIELNFNARVFQNMCNLRLLKIYNSRGVIMKTIMHLTGDLDSLSDKLAYLQWDGYPRSSLPENFAPQNLVELIMPNSRLKKLWNGVQNLEGLKKVDLSNNNNLAEIPDLARARNLVTLNLEGCLSVHKFPQLPRNVKSLNLAKTSIEQVPSSSIENLSRLEILDLSDCTNLESLPTNICRLKSLQSLYLSGCSKFKSFPEILEPMECLTELELDRTAIKELHDSIQNLVRLEILHLEMCQNLESIPDSIYNISSLDYVSLWRCPKFRPSSEIIHSNHEPEVIPSYHEHSDACDPELGPTTENTDVISLPVLSNTSSEKNEGSDSSRTMSKPNVTASHLQPRWDHFSQMVDAGPRRFNYLHRSTTPSNDMLAQLTSSDGAGAPTKSMSKFLSTLYNPTLRCIVKLAKVLQQEP